MPRLFLKTFFLSNRFPISIYYINQIRRSLLVLLGALGQGGFLRDCRGVDLPLDPPLEVFDGDERVQFIVALLGVDGAPQFLDPSQHLEKIGIELLVGGEFGVEVKDIF